MNFHRHLAQAEFGGNLLVQISGRHAGNDFALAGTERAKSFAQGGVQFHLFAPRPIALQAGKNRIQHVLVAERLGEKIHGAGLHGAHGHGDVAMGRHEHDRHLHVGSGELFLEFQPVGARQPHVQHEAPRGIGDGVLQESAAGGIGLDRQANGLEQLGER